MRKQPEQLAAAAAAERSPISATAMRRVVKAMMAIVDNEKASYRCKTAAARALAGIRKNNLNAIATAIAAKRFEDLEQRLTAKLEDLETRIRESLPAEDRPAAGDAAGATGR